MTFCKEEKNPVIAPGGGKGRVGGKAPGPEGSGKNLTIRKKRMTAKPGGEASLRRKKEHARKRSL